MPESDQPKSEPAGAPAVPSDERQKLFARRALIQAGWVIPAVAAFSVPKIAGAASGHADGGHLDLGQPHIDIGPPHSDARHTDQHFDNGVPHTDIIPHADFVEDGAPHSDIIHADAGGPQPPHSDA